MRLKLITTVLGGTLLALALGACGEEPPKASSPTTITNSQSSRLQPSVPTHAPTSQSIAEQTPTLTPAPSSRASAAGSTFSRMTPCVPLDQPAFLAAGEGGYLPGEDLVLGLEWMGEARAYPIRMLTYHHIVNDVVAARPLLVTY